ncbi:PD-(D/E)XK nuclease-like domain-containing protein [Methylobacterium sp. JK268]
MLLPDSVAAAPPAVLIEDGIYFGLDEARYHADPALGSSDLKRLAAEPADYWFGSVHNPNRPAEESTPSQVIGRAVHKLVLEGQQSFAAAFERETTGDVLRTSEEIADYLTAELGVTKPPRGKADRIALLQELCRDPLPMPPVLDLIQAAAADAGRLILKAEDFDRIQRAAGAVLANPHLAASFTGGASEVSVFWTDAVDGEPVRRKARFDYLKPRAVVDLKSTRPSRPTSFEANCLRAMAEFGYPVQAAAYLQGRALLARLVADGRVHGDHDPAWLARVAAAPAYAFVFVFWSTGDAPLTWGVTLSPGNEVLAIAEKTVEAALWNFVCGRRAHGLERPWIDHAPLAEIAIDDLPRWWGATR